ncbi:uncharacterized protein LOC126377481 [Pectinophora gossypiella]|uniref:uncharacterized protein LOC126377481 n=1 Tax=Pectinophora gossypiella TaxID=13191 RepID=UPI00214F4298|nr:uncharacterized protein LOC126377481 [Pectinophora gossypiella]
MFSDDETMDGIRAVVPVALIQDEFCVGAAAEVAILPEQSLQHNARVLLGESWNDLGRRVRSYLIHPEYGPTYNTIALIQLKDPIRNGIIFHLCPPPEILRDPQFYIVRFKDDYNDLKKEVIPMHYVPRRMCRDFYVAANLYAEKMRPPHVVCATSMEHDNVCVWEAGAVLVSRDVWGRWQLLGFGVRGPGCAGPSRYLDMLSYYPWIHSSLHQLQRLTISKIHRHKYVLRTSAGASSLQKFGDCNIGPNESKLYREFIKLRTDNNQYQFLTYNMTIQEAMEITCMTLELVNASASSEMRVKHSCPRNNYGPACHYYRNSYFDISVFLMFSDACTFEMIVYGIEKNMTLMHIMEGKWEEGSYYKNFIQQRVEYKGQSFMTTYGFEPLEPARWLPSYDVWSTTEVYNGTTSRTTEPPNRDATGASTTPKAAPLPNAPAPTRRWKGKNTRPSSKPPKTVPAKYTESEEEEVIETTTTTRRRKRPGGR